MRPTEGTMKRTSLWLTVQQYDGLAETARIVGSNVSQIIRDEVDARLRREKRVQKQLAQKQQEA